MRIKLEVIRMKYIPEINAYPEIPQLVQPDVTDEGGILELMPFDSGS